ncbi:hypothetical protein PHYSODRAFT_533351, partial [Phytophthora sojae]
IHNVHDSRSQSMVVVDQYKAVESGFLESAIVNFNTFISQLAYQLVFNDFVMHRSTRVTIAADFRDDVAPPTHTLYAFSTLPRYKRLSGTILRAQRKCSICGRKASYYCSGCSDPLENNFFEVCGLKTGRDCHSLHLNTTLV